jgi:HEAT repeat protein
MFETPQSRKEFLLSVKTGRINAAMLQKAADQASVFADQNPDEILALMGVNEATAAFATAVFGALKHPEKGVKLVEAMVKERSPEGEAALSKLAAQVPLEDLIAGLGRMVNSKNLEHRKKALKMLVKLDNWPRHDQLVQPLLQDPNREIAEVMARQVAAKAPARYVQYLRQFSRSEDGKTRETCLHALMNLKKVRHADLFLERLPFEEGELKDALRANLSQFLKTEAQTITKEVVKAITSDIPQVRATAMALFTKLPNKSQAFRIFLQFSGSVSSFLRDQMFQEARKFADALVDPILATCQQEKDQGIRLQAIQLAKVLKHQKLAGLFLKELKSDDWMVRYTAIQTLSEMKSPQAVQPFLEMLKEPDAATAAVQALDRYRDIRLAKPLFQHLPKAPANLQIEIVKLLENLGDGRFLPHFAKFLEGNAFKEPALKQVAMSAKAIGIASGTEVPSNLRDLHDKLVEKTMADLPDLGLKLSDEV